MVVHRAMLRRIYDWCIDAAAQALRAVDHGSGVVRGKLVLSGAAGCDAAADVAGAAAAGVALRRRFARRRRLPGGVLGYAIGALLYDSVGQWLINLYGLTATRSRPSAPSYAEYGAPGSSCCKGLTPIPYKLVHHHLGFCRLQHLAVHRCCSIIARGGRFFVVAILLNRYGDIDPGLRIEKHLGLWVALAAGVLVLGFVIAFRMF